MTETTVAPGVVDDPSTYVPAPPDETLGGDNRQRRLMLLGGGLAGAVLLAVAAFFLLVHHGGSGSTPPAPTTPPVTHPLRANAAPNVPVVHLPASFTGTIGRDPFTPLLTAPSPAASTAATTPGTVPSTAPSTAPTTSGTGTGATGGNAFCSGSAGQGNLTPTWIELDSSGANWAIFRVAYTNGCTVVWPKVSFAGAAVTFAKVFQLLSLKTGAATIREADGQPFSLRQGYANRHLFG